MFTQRLIHERIKQLHLSQPKSGNKLSIIECMENEYTHTLSSQTRIITRQKKKKKNELLVYATMWVNFKSSMLKEVRLRIPLSVRFDLYKILEKTKPIYSDRKQFSSCLGHGRRGSYLEETEKKFQGDENISNLEETVYICQNLLKCVLKMGASYYI